MSFCCAVRVGVAVIPVPPCGGRPRIRTWWAYGRSVGTASSLGMRQRKTSAVPSGRSAPEARVLPSGENRIERTGPACGSSGQQFLTDGHVPELDDPAAVAAGDRPSIGRKGQGIDVVRVSLEVERHSSVSELRIND